MTWGVLFHDDFDAEFAALDEALQDELLAHAKLLEEFGPNLGRPTVDTLKGSKHANMKERRFYRRLIALSDERYDSHLASLITTREKEPKHGKKTR